MEKIVGKNPKIKLITKSFSLNIQSLLITRFLAQKFELIKKSLIDLNFSLKALRKLS